MIELNDLNKFNWVIKYITLKDQTLNILVDGNKFDFIPSEGDFIKIDNHNYKVIMRTFDFDKSIIWISLFEEQNKNQ